MWVTTLNDEMIRSEIERPVCVSEAEVVVEKSLNLSVDWVLQYLLQANGIIFRIVQCDTYLCGCLIESADIQRCQ